MLTVAVAAAAAALSVAALLSPPAQALPPGSILGLSLPAPTSTIEPAACRGRNVNCPPGRYWVCGPYGHRCWCAPC